MIDVIVPFHRESDIKNIKSWNLKMFKEFTFALVHDSSRKLCTGACLELLEVDSNIALVCGRYGAPGIARNAGLKMSNNEWVMFVDGDDSPNFELIKQVHFNAIQRECNVFMGSFKESNANGNFVNVNEIPYVDLPKYIANKPGLWRFAFTRNILDGITFTKHRWGEDQLFLLKVLSRHDVMLHVENVCIYEYKLGDNQVTNEMDSALDLIAVLKEEYALFSGSKYRKFQELYDLFVTRQSITLIRALGFKSPKITIAKTFFSPFSLLRFARKMVFAFTVLSNKVQMNRLNEAKE